MTQSDCSRLTTALCAGFLACCLCGKPACAARTVALNQTVAPETSASIQVPSEERHPIVVLREATGWAASIWSGPATFVLYDDGLALYVHPGQDPDPQKMTRYDCVKLGTAEKNALLASLKTDAFTRLKPYYPSNTLDAPQTIISIWQDGTMKSVAIDGFLRDTPQGINVNRVSSKRACYPDARMIAPSSFVSAYDKLANFTDPAAQPWNASRFELMLQAGDHIKTVSWPVDLSDVTLPSSVLKGVQTDLCVFRLPLNEDQCARLSELEDDANANGVVIHGKKWASALYTHLPGEQYWIGRAW